MRGGLFFLGGLALQNFSECVLKRTHVLLGKFLAVGHNVTGEGRQDVQGFFTNWSLVEGNEIHDFVVGEGLGLGLLGLDLEFRIAGDFSHVVHKGIFHLGHFLFVEVLTGEALFYH